MKRGAIIGLGGIGKYHLKAAEDAADIIAVCDADKNKLDLFDKYKKYSNYDELIEKEKLDFVDICLPHSFHFSAIKKAVEYGLDVLCEKPLVHNEKELEDLEKLMQDKSSKLIVNYNYSYSPQFQVLKNLISDGKVGKPLYILLRVDMRDSFWESSWRKNKNISGGGIFLDDGIHLCYLSRWLLNSKPKTVLADIRNITFEKEHPDDFGKALFEFENGSVADLCCTAFKRNKKSFSYRRVDCENATLILPYYSLSPNVEIYWKDGNIAKISIIPEIKEENDHFHAEFIHSYKELLRDYSQNKFRNPNILFPNCKMDLDMIFGAYKSSDLKKKYYF